MTGFALERLSLRLGGFQLAGLDIALARGEILALLGPNGAGKSVTLEAIAGFHRIDGGRILIGGRDVTDLPPERRRVSLLFQNFALFPHLTVAGNMALALRAARADQSRGTALLERFGVAALAPRWPETLSPGEKQRVALARAIVGSPELFLFDEPFSALDAPTRAALRDGLRHFLRDAGATAIFVTHDAAEAMALADRLALMRGGALLQQGAAAQVYRAPQTAFAAAFLGVENILPARLLGRDGGFWRVTVGSEVLRVDGEAPRTEPLSIGIRAEDVVLSLAPHAAGNLLAARVLSVVDAGALTRIALDCGFALFAALARREAEALALAPGTAVSAAIDPAAIRLLG